MEVPLWKTLIFLEKSGALAHQSRHLYEHDIFLLYMKICTLKSLFSSVISNLSVIVTFVIRMQYSPGSQKKTIAGLLKRLRWFSLVFLFNLFTVSEAARSRTR